MNDVTSAGTRQKSQVAAYIALFGVQTVGIAIILWQGVPILRLVLNNPGPQHAQLEHLIWGLVAIALVQGAYWLRLLRIDVPKIEPNIVLGHLVFLAARLSFVFGGAVFAAVFYVRAPQLTFSFWRITFLVAILFSIFCYTRELERIGQVLERQAAE